MHLDVHFIDAVQIGEFVEAKCRVVRRTRSLIFMSGEFVVGRHGRDRERRVEGAGEARVNDRSSSGRRDGIVYAPLSGVYAVPEGPGRPPDLAQYVRRIRASGWFVIWTKWPKSDTMAALLCDAAIKNGTRDRDAAGVVRDIRNWERLRHDRHCPHRVAAAVHVRRARADHPASSVRSRRCARRSTSFPTSASRSSRSSGSYTGLPPDEMAGRIVTQFERALTTTVNDIEHIEVDLL